MRRGSGMGAMMPPESGDTARIVIIGGGFGGFYTALNVEKATRGRPERPAVTLLSETNHLVYTPFLPAAAGGTLEPRHVVVPLRSALKRTQVLRGRVTGHDRERREIVMENDTGVRSVVGYDQLVVAPGSVSRTLPIPGLAENAVGF